MSSRAWAPRDSFRASAETMVWSAQVKRFRSSRVSTRSLHYVHTSQQWSSGRSGEEYVRVPNHRTILDSDILPCTQNTGELSDSMFKGRLSSEDSCVVLPSPTKPNHNQYRLDLYTKPKRKSNKLTCMHFCISNLISEVCLGPSLVLISSNERIESIPASAEITL